MVKSMRLSWGELSLTKLSPSSRVRSTTTGVFRIVPAATAQMCPLKTLRVMINPQWHLAKRRLNSDSESPGRAQESSRRSRSNTVSGPLMGASYVGTDVATPGPANTCENVNLKNALPSPTCQRNYWEQNWSCISSGLTWDWCRSRIFKSWRITISAYINIMISSNLLTAGGVFLRKQTSHRIEAL